MPLPRQPVFIESAFDDPAAVSRLVERHAPYWPVQRYFASAEEQRALSDSADRPGAAPGKLVVGPVFRGNWAYDRPLVDGVAPLLDHAPLVDAARRIFDAAIVRPQILYVNLSLPMPCGDGGHTDVPAFRGVDRTTAPVWLLVTMGRSGLFERWRLRIATAVAWFYEGQGGALTYWPHGPDAPPASLPARTNTALVGDNDVMFHRVEAVGGPDDDMVRGLTLDSELAFSSDLAWEVRDGDRVLGRWPGPQVRVSLSWKALVFRDRDEARAFDEHTDDLTVTAALDRLAADLAARGVDLPASTDPLHDPAFVAAASRAYHASPTVYPWGRVEAS
jgi:hypothetical protein